MKEPGLRKPSFLYLELGVNPCVLSFPMKSMVYTVRPFFKPVLRGASRQSVLVEAELRYQRRKRR
jgi:hypothetical protein